MGSQANAEKIAHQVSPLTYVRSDLPPIITIHGNKDSVVPYSQATRLTDALDKAHAPNKLVTIKGGDHGMFTQEQYKMSYSEIWAFLREHKVIN